MAIGHIVNLDRPLGAARVVLEAAADERTPIPLNEDRVSPRLEKVSAARGTWQANLAWRSK